MATIRPRITTKGEKRWQAIIKRDGRTTSKSFRTKYLAREWARQKEADLDRNEIPGAHLKAHTLADALTAFCDSLDPANENQKLEVNRINNILKDAVCKISLSKLKSADINGYIARRRKNLTPRYLAAVKAAEQQGFSHHEIEKEFISDGTIAKERSLMSRACTHLREIDTRFEDLSHAAFRDSKKLNKNKRSKRLESSESERDRLLESTKRARSHYLRYAVEILLETGARRGELFKAQWRHFDERRSVLFFPGSITKSGEDRAIPLSDRARELIVEYSDTHRKATDKHIFEGITVNAYRQAFRRAAERAGLRKKFGALEEMLRSHDLRREANSALLESGVLTEAEVMNVVGHGDVQTNAIYRKFSAARMAEKMNGQSSIKVSRATLAKLDAFAEAEGTDIDQALLILLERASLS